MVSLIQKPLLTFSITLNIFGILFGISALMSKNLSVMIASAIVVIAGSILMAYAWD